MIINHLNNNNILNEFVYDVNYLKLIYKPNNQFCIPYTYNITSLIHCFNKSKKIKITNFVKIILF